MSVSGFRPAEPTDDLHLGNVREDAQIEAAAEDRNKDNVLSKEEMYVANANRQPVGTTLPRYETWKPAVPPEHDVRPLDARELAGAVAAGAGAPYAAMIAAGRFGSGPGIIGTGPLGSGPFSARDLIAQSEHLGNFHIDGMGYGNARFMRSNVGGRDLSTFVIDAGGFDHGMLLDPDTRIRIVVAPRNFAPDATDKLDLPDAVLLPCHVDVTPPSYTRGGIVPGSCAAFATVETAKLRELAEGSDELAFYVEIEAKGHPKSYANLDGVPFQNFRLPVDRIR